MLKNKEIIVRYNKITEGIKNSNNERVEKYIVPENSNKIVWIITDGVSSFSLISRKGMDGKLE